MIGTKRKLKIAGHLTLVPELKNRDGQIGLVERKLDETENDPENETLYKVRFPDGFVGDVFESELIELNTMNESEIAILIRDAMGQFIAAREKDGIDAYVATRYPWMSQKQQEEKYQQVVGRIEVANKIKFLSGKIGEFLETLLPTVTEDDLS